MISQRSLSLGLPASFKEQYLGTVGYLAIFFFSITAVMFTPAPRLPWATGVCLLAAALVYPQAFRSLMRLRWLVMIGLMALPPLFLIGDLDHSLAGIPYSSEGLLSGMQIALRVLVVLVAIQGMTGSVDISSVASACTGWASP